MPPLLGANGKTIVELAGDVVLLLAFTGYVSAASAEIMQFEPGGSITMSGPFTLRLGGQATFRCNVTLVGSLTTAAVSEGRTS
jgi:hypothetical protein